MTKTDIQRLFEIAGVANFPMARTIASSYGDQEDMAEPEAIETEIGNEESNEDTPDTICIDVPAIIRLMEYAREDAQTDEELHVMAERMVAASKDGTVTMAFFDQV